MKIYQTQQEVEKDIKDGILAIEEDVKFECSISIEASIKVIGDINAGNIKAGDINAGNINASDIDAGDINARNIDAGDINARNINAWDIDAGDINARDILYYAFCCVYNNIKCLSIKAKRDVYKEPICLDGSLELKTQDDDVEKAIKLLEERGKLKDGKILI